MRIMRDSRGFLWFCTVDGLSRFDGNQFTTYGRDHGLSVTFINDILEARPGEYWVATNGGGIARLNSGNSPPTSSSGGRTQSRFTIYRVGDGTATNRVRVLRRDRAGRLWAGTDGGLFRFEETKSNAGFRRVDLGLASHVDDEVEVWAVLEDREGSLWLGTSAGLVRRLPNGKVSHYPFDADPGPQLIRGLLEDRDGRIWIAKQRTILAVAPRPNAVSADPTRALTIKRFTSPDWLAAGRLRALFQSADGRIWAGSSIGLSEFDGERFRSHPVAQDSGGHAINALAEDSDGNLWIGTDLGGALKVARTGFVSFKRPDGLPNPWIMSIFEDRAGKLNAISAGGLAINQFDGQRFTTVRPNLPESVVRARLAPILGFKDHAGEWWFPTIRGLYRFAQAPRIEHLAQAQPKAVYHVKDGLASEDLFGAFEDSRGDLWFGTRAPAREGLTRWERATGAFHRYSDREGLPTFNAPSAFGEDTAGNLWIGFANGGLARYRDDRFTLFTSADGAPAREVAKIYRDRARRLWVASSDGLSRVDDPAAEHPRFLTQTTANGLSSNETLCVTEDKWGHLYVGTTRGIDRIDPATGRVKHYNTTDGLAGSEVLQAFRDRGGALWFATYQGLSRMTPEADRPAPPPPVFIGGLRIAGIPQPVSELGETEVTWRELGPNQNHVQIDFFGLSFASGGALQYQYKLERPDREWSAPTTQRTIHYANLAPGVYRFLVRAVSPDGTLSPTPASVAFDILPPLWRRQWFITLMGLLVASAVFAFDRYRVARLKEVGAALGESQRLTVELTEQRAELRQANQALELEYAITRILAEATTPLDAMPRMLHAICENTGWEIGVVWNVDPQSRVLRCVDLWHPPDTAASAFEALTRQLVLLPGEGLPGQVLESGQARWVTDLNEDANSPRIAAAAQEGLRSAFGFPLLLRGEVIGVLEFFSRERREPDPEQTKMMATIGGDIGQLIEGKRAEDALRQSREERLAELEQVRRRIATDLHDDIGSSLTQISILSEVIRQRTDHQDSPVSQPLSKIAGASRELVDAMSDIVWAINPQKDHLHDLTQRMRRFAADSFTALNIKFQLRLPDEEEDVRLGANLRREVFLIFKEGVNNMVRHSGCTEADIELRFAEGSLRLVMSDNGCGFDITRQSDGHGLMSMRDRARGIGGRFVMNSQPGQGTFVELEVPLDGGHNASAQK